MSCIRSQSASSFARCCAFNRRGSHLAVGSKNGDLVLWDFATRAEAKIIPVHSLDGSLEQQTAIISVRCVLAFPMRKSTIHTLFCSWLYSGRHILTLTQRCLKMVDIQTEEVTTVLTTERLRTQGVSVLCSPHASTQCVPLLLLLLLG